MINHSTFSSKWTQKMQHRKCLIQICKLPIFLFFHRTLHEKAVLWYSIQSSISKVLVLTIIEQIVIADIWQATNDASGT